MLVMYFKFNGPHYGITKPKPKNKEIINECLYYVFIIKA